MAILYQKTLTVAEVVARFGMDEPYGVSPAMEALPLLKAYNALPPEERARASAAYVRERLADLNDEWWG